jgi:hypothetical protein
MKKHILFSLYALAHRPLPRFTDLKIINLLRCFATLKGNLQQRLELLLFEAARIFIYSEGGSDEL